jgi:hypothetical protein
VVYWLHQHIHNGIKVNRCANKLWIELPSRKGNKRYALASLHGRDLSQGRQAIRVIRSSHNAATQQFHSDDKSVQFSKNNNTKHIDNRQLHCYSLWIIELRHAVNVWSQIPWVELG